jgi:predicted membrane-bound mannosyltransferase
MEIQNDAGKINFVIAIRFLHLGIQALSENEANLALQALSTAKGQMINWSGEPLYLALTSLLFTIFDQNNFIARLIPAIFGTLLIAIPFLYRKNTGNWETIILTAFLAIDPSLVSLSRTAGGSTISLYIY